MKLIKTYEQFSESLSEKKSDDVVEFTALNNMGRPHWRTLIDDGHTFSDIDLARAFINDRLNRRKFMKNVKLRIGKKEYELKG